MPWDNSFFQPRKRGDGSDPLPYALDIWQVVKIFPGVILDFGKGVVMGMVLLDELKVTKQRSDPEGHGRKRIGSRITRWMK